MILRVTVQGLSFRMGNRLSMGRRASILAKRLNNGNAGVQVRAADNPMDLQAVKDILAERRPAEVEVLEHEAFGGLKVEISGLTYREADGKPSEDTARRILGQRLSTVLSEIPEGTIQLREGEGVANLPGVLVDRLPANFRADDVKVEEYTPIIGVPSPKEFDGDVAGILKRSGSLRSLRIDGALDMVDMRSDLARALEMLTPNQSTLLILRFGLHDGKPRKRKEVAEIMGCGVGRIDRAMSFLRVALYGMKERA